ncbi:hypothetical protein F5146DRAFT_999108 [Armillaria mellea]|nr:hypothetical protein F5146DRAFT_999108 [Armillaria mellea]
MYPVPLNRTIDLVAKVVSANVLQSTMIVEWSTAHDPFNIFFDINLSPSDPRYNNGPYSNSMTTDPIIVWSGDTRHTVRTELVMSTDMWSYFSAYPFDMHFRYYADIYAFA